VSVSKHIVEHCFMGLLKTKTRILVTHDLDVSRHADMVIVMHGGRIAQQGSYDDLTRSSGIFQSLVKEYGNVNQAVEAKNSQSSIESADQEPEDKQVLSPQKPGRKHDLDEERGQGTVSVSVYWSYLKAMRISGFFAVGMIGLILSQCAEIASSLFLGFWSRSTIQSFGTSQYIGAYAGLGGSVAFFTFIAAYSMTLAGLRAAFLMFGSAIRNVLRSPLCFHDRTPSGRITSRLTKDVQTVDDDLASNLNLFLTQLAGVIGTFALILYSFPIFSPFLAAMLLSFWVFASFYRHTSRQIKRIDSTTRSFVISKFCEQIAGVTFIRAYNQQRHFLQAFSDAVNYQNRFYYVAIIIRRWMALRIQAVGSLMVFAVSIFGLLTTKVSPAIFSVVLTYTIQTTGSFSKMVLKHAQVEQRE
jgi:ATP-binding cassette subfamily C (CFTR/MRP) protein 1